MNVPDFPVQVPVDDPNADTEWNDILRKHGVLPPKPPSPTPLLEEALLAAHQHLHEARLDHATLDELADLEDEEDPLFLEQYRQRRIAELQKLRNAPHGSVYPLTKAEYTKAVTDASMHPREGSGTTEAGAGAGAGQGTGTPIFVNLTGGEGGVESRVLSELWREIARKYPDVKFCQMKASLAIEGYPERNCPTILVYDMGEIARQVVTLREWGGAAGVKLSDIETLLVQTKAIKPDDQRLRKQVDEGEEEDERRRERSSIKFGGAAVKANNAKGKGRYDDDDEDDDWD